MNIFLNGIIEPFLKITEMHKLFIFHSLLSSLPHIFSELTKNKKPQEQYLIAYVFREFGIVLQQFPRGDQSLNLELSLTALQIVLKIFTYNAFSSDWANTQHYLGNAYLNRIRGKRADNIERAINSFELALQIFSHDTFPMEWASTQNNLGIAYNHRIRDEHSDNIERAIDSFELALQVYTRDAFPTRWANTQRNLGNAYLNRIREKRADNIERAIASFELALQVYTRNAFPFDWANTQNNLGIAYRDRIIGEHSDNIEQAISAFQLALNIYTLKIVPEAWATTRANLSSCLIHDGQWQEGLQLLLNSVTHLSTSDAPLTHANSLYQTGRAYEVLGDLDKARTYYRDALRLYEYLKDQLGTTQSRAGLGSVLVSQGYLEKGLNELEKVRDGDGYLLLPKDTQTEFDNIYQAAKRALERSNNEVYV
jgi:tetratricopeptide (TPR) repeat protein